MPQVSRIKNLEVFPFPSLKRLIMIIYQKKNLYLEIILNYLIKRLLKLKKKKRKKIKWKILMMMLI